MLIPLLVLWNLHSALSIAEGWAWGSSNTTLVQAEYIALVEAMRSGQYVDSDEYQRLSSERTVTHDELLRLTGMMRQHDMYRHYRTVLEQG